MSEYTDPEVGDIVQIVRDGRPGLREWKVIDFHPASDLICVDLVRGSLLGPQWEDRTDVVFVRRPGGEEAR